MRLSPLVLGLALALPATAHADSISYIKDGNVWLSTSDGARQFQVTVRRWLQLRVPVRQPA